MPGIYGAVSLRPDRDPAPVAAAMGRLITHQPWYETASWSHGAVSLGAVSTNPAFRAERHLVSRSGVVLLLEGTALTLEGRHLPDDGPELAQRFLDLYLDRGDAFIHSIHGHFNLVIHDANQRRLQLVNDHLGFAHMYWYCDDDVLLFAPELKAFLGWRGFDHTVDRASVATMLAKECPYGDGTFFARVKMLPQGGRLVLENGAVKISRYHIPTYQPEAERSVAETIDEAYALFERSVDKRVQTHHTGRVLVAVSGGLDSRLLLHHVRERGDDLELFTYGQPGCNETAISRETCRVLGLEHRWRLIETNPDWLGQHARQAVWLNDGQVNSRNATLLGIAKELGPGPSPYLSGILGPYMSIGTGHFCKEADLGIIADEQELRRRVLKFSGVEGGVEGFAGYMTPETATEMGEAAREQVWDSFQEHRHAPTFGDQKMLHMHFNLGRRMQAAVYANKFFFHDLTPFVDPELFDFYLRLPPRAKWRNVIYQEMYRRRMTDLARVRWSRTDLDLFSSEAEVSASLAARGAYLARLQKIRRWSLGLLNPKSRYAYNHREVWLRTNKRFRTEMTGVLRDLGATGCDLFDQHKVNSLLRGFDRGRDWLYADLSQIYAVGIWYDLFQTHVPAGAELGHVENNFVR